MAMVAVWAAALLVALRDVFMGDPKAASRLLSTRAVISLVISCSARSLVEADSKGLAPLDLAPNAVDDMYGGCRDEMEKKAKVYLANERNKDKNLSLAWAEAEKYYNKRCKHNGRRPCGSLGKEQAMAIYVYTLNKPKIYLDFNRAVRSQRSQYKTTFRYHALHFFLTDALQKLNSRRAERCLTGFRRANATFSRDALNKRIRFGSFTSSSMGSYLAAGKFGDESCFEIVTCSGADISLFSKAGESEREVLIPPYEVFKVAKIERRSVWKNLPCEVVYKLRSTGEMLSNLNCALFSSQAAS